MTITFLYAAGNFIENSGTRIRGQTGRFPFGNEGMKGGQPDPLHFFELGNKNEAGQAVPFFPSGLCTVFPLLEYVFLPAF